MYSTYFSPDRRVSGTNSVVTSGTVVATTGRGPLKRAPALIVTIGYLLNVPTFESYRKIFQAGRPDSRAG